VVVVFEIIIINTEGREGSDECEEMQCTKDVRERDRDGRKNRGVERG
jgi:hypothetical protein